MSGNPYDCKGMGEVSLQKSSKFYGSIGKSLFDKHNIGQV